MSEFPEFLVKATHPLDIGEIELMVFKYGISVQALNIRNANFVRISYRRYPVSYDTRCRELEEILKKLRNEGIISKFRNVQELKINKEDYHDDKKLGELLEV